MTAGAPVQAGDGGGPTRPRVKAAEPGGVAEDNEANSALVPSLWPPSGCAIKRGEKRGGKMPAE